MNTKQLRQKILDLAIKGKLVPQDPNDEPASKLLERIRAEKEQLIKDKKIKRDKNESSIFVGDDKLHYEKFADGSVVCIENEIPFEIPENWAWCRLKEVCTKIVDGAHNPPRRENAKTEYIMASSTNINNDKLVELEKVRYLSKKNYIKENERTDLKKGDILLTTVGTLGRSCVYNNDLNICFQRSVSVITTLIHNFYLKIFFDSDVFQQKINTEATGTAQKGFYLNQLSDVLIPLPPTLEQVRISNTVQELLEIIDAIENNKIDLSELIKQTKSKVLDLAIRGKLVPQDPNDEPADKLLEKIREEKEKLIKEGRLKRDKNETFIYKNSDDNSYYEQIDGETICIDDDLPFEIPDSWRWERLSAICCLVNGEKVNDRKLTLLNVKYLRTKKNKEYLTSGIILNSGDFVILVDGENSGEVFKILETGFMGSTLKKLFISENFCNEYLLYLLKFYKKLFRDNKTGSAIPHLNKDLFKNLLIGIPPLMEQQRIAIKIENIFSYLDILETIIKGS